jgi:hypothetical protein
VASLVATNAHAFNSTYFPMSDVKTVDGKDVEIALAVGDGKWTSHATADLFIYFPQNSGRVEILNKDYCYDKSGSNLNSYHDAPDTGSPGTITDGQRITRYKLSSVPDFFGSYRTSESGCPNTGWINVTNLPYDKSLGLYVAHMRAEPHATQGSEEYKKLFGHKNKFGIRASNPDGSIGQVKIAHRGGADDIGQAVTVEQRGSKSYKDGSTNLDANFSNYKIKFGSDCTVTSNREATFLLYDLDQNGYDPPGVSTQKHRDVTVRMYKTVTNPTTGVTTDEPVNLTSKRYLPDSTDTLSDLGNNGVRPGNSNNRTLAITFIAEPSARYYVTLGNIYTDNTIQFTTPFDGIYYDFPCPTQDIYPRIEIGRNVIFPGETILSSEIKHRVMNINGPSSAEVSPYGVYEYVIRKGLHKPTNSEVGGVFKFDKNVPAVGVVRYAQDGIVTTACDWLRTQSGFGDIDSNCKLLARDDRSFSERDNLIDVTTPIVADDYQMGDMVCRILSIGSYTPGAESNSRRISYPACVTIAKSPSVQVWGNDIRVGDSIYSAGPSVVNGPNDEASVYTRFSTIGDSTYGSWSEYGIFAPTNGVIKSVSGGAIASAPAKPLSFANITSPDSGHWGSARVIPTILDRISNIPQGKVTNADQININEDLNESVTDGQWYKVTNESANITIDDPPQKGYKANRGTVVFDFTKGSAPKTVRIKRNITLDRGDDKVAYNKLGGATQIIIVVRGNIIIEPEVSNVDAWLIALPSSSTSINDGIISTCAAITTPYYNGLTVSHACNNNKLTINGAVMAKQIQLRRTNGAEKPDYGAPAEVINLRADAYMWGPNSTSNEDGVGYPIRTIMTKELPPRF